ncbi:MAG: response regulator, partial [Gemmataceae bacterium]
RVLLADDNEILRSLAATHLRRAGYDVLTAADGHEATELFRREQARLDLVVLDARLAGLSGAEAIAVMRRVRPDVKVLFVGEEGEGPADALDKPYREGNLVEAVRALLGDA